MGNDPSRFSIELTEEERAAAIRSAQDEVRQRRQERNEERAKEEAEKLAKTQQQEKEKQNVEKQAASNATVRLDGREQTTEELEKPADDRTAEKAALNLRIKALQADLKTQADKKQADKVAAERAALAAKVERAQRDLAEQYRVPSVNGAPSLSASSHGRSDRNLAANQALNATSTGSSVPRSAATTTARTPPPTRDRRSSDHSDDASHRRSSEDSGIGSSPRSDAERTRPVKVPTGPRRGTVNDDNRAMAPPPPSQHGSGNRKRSSTMENVDARGSNGPDRTPKKTKTSISSLEPLPQALTIDSWGPEGRQPPEWYRKLTVDRKRAKSGATVEPQLQFIRNKIRQCKDARFIASPRQAQQAAFNEIRTRLHGLPFLKVNEQLLRNNMMLSNEAGLPQLFDDRFSGGVDWPFDIKADAKELYIKWYCRVFETDLLRGIIPGNGKSGVNERSSDRLDDNWRRIPYNYHGNRNLVNGQWWPTQLAVLRDGGHGSAMAGICGQPGQGAWSCVISGGHEYNNEDYGDVVLYCGTDSDDGKITHNTKLMLESHADGRPVRLFRSHKGDQKWSPPMGLRYDGLYDIVSYELQDPETSLRQRHRFKMVRQPNQDPIRSTGPERRPTQQEMEAHQKDQRLRGVSSSAVKGKKGTIFPTWG